MYIDLFQDFESAGGEQILNMSRPEHPDCFINVIEISLEDMCIFTECIASKVLEAL